MAGKKQPSQIVVAADPNALAALQKQQEEAAIVAEGGAPAEPGVLDMLLKSLQTHEKAQRMSFEVNPTHLSAGAIYSFLYRQKIGLIPDELLKKLAGPSGDDLVCQILQARSNIMASFGRPRTSRFAVGFEFVEIGDKIPEDDDLKEKLKERLEKVKEFLWNCGSDTPAGKEYFKPNLSQLMKMCARDAAQFGRIAVERMYVPDPNTGDKKFVAFRPVDAGTIYYIIPKREHDQSTRDKAMRLLAELRNEKIDARKYDEDEYRYVQVINQQPQQTFTEEELVMYNFYPTNAVEFNGYPLTPIDQSINAIITHVNITLHNKLYFQHGRATRGMLIMKSSDGDEGTTQQIRNQFHQSINSVQNSWRMPVFGIGPDDELTWTPIDASGRDGEFMALMDNNARVILSAFQMSPEELPGYAHLARGTNTQALSESDQEWKLTAARDVGLRPLIYDFQDFFNTHIIPEIDVEIAKYYKLVFSGLEQDSPEKEATRLSQDMPIHMTYNDVLERVEKDTIDKELGGDVPLNPQFHQLVLGPFLTVGEIMENYMGRKGAAKDPRYAYYRDPLWLQFQQIVMQKAQMSMQNSMMQQQQQQAMQPQPEEEQAPEGASDAQKAEIAQNNLRKREDWMANNFTLLSKTIQDNHNDISKAILARHKELVDKQLDKWKKDSADAVKKIISSIKNKKGE